MEHSQHIQCCQETLGLWHSKGNKGLRMCMCMCVLPEKKMTKCRIASARVYVYVCVCVTFEGDFFGEKVD